MSRLTIACFALALGCLWAAPAWAQPQATAVQLPTFSFFSVGTTVSVPDRGSTLLGGINRASDGRNEFGAPILGKLPVVGRPFKNVGIGSERSAQNVRVSAYIHDFDELEQAVLAGAGDTRQLSALGDPQRGVSNIAALGRQLQPRNPELGRSWQVAAAQPSPTPSLADAQAQRATAATVRADDAQSCFDRAEKLMAEGKPNVAKIYYQMAARRASGDLHKQAVARLESLSNQSGSASQVAASGR